MSLDYRVRTLYEMDSIGVGGALEAVAAFAFCSDACREKYRQRFPEMEIKVAEEPMSAFADRHGCDECGNDLAPGSGATMSAADTVLLSSLHDKADAYAHAIETCAESCLSTTLGAEAMAAMWAASVVLYQAMTRDGRTPEDIHEAMLVVIESTLRAGRNVDPPTAVDLLARALRPS